LENKIHSSEKISNQLYKIEGGLGSGGKNN
jgi:hypothetical protein